VRSRLVLEDAWHAHELLEGESSPETFRVLWVSGVALARAVGHVLDKVDGASDPRLRLAVDEAWAAWRGDPEGNAVFWRFIEDERNQVLKQYEVGFFSGPALLTVEGQEFQLGEQLFCGMTDGPFAGEDCRDVLAEALRWWETQLHAVERAARGLA